MAEKFGRAIEILILILVCTSAAVVTGYLVGFNHGFTVGKKIGHIEAGMQKQGMCFRHNNEIEKDTD